jgi:hypothetical protein
MKKYIVINKETNQVICKRTNNKRRYRQSFNAIEKGLKIVMLSKENAQAEADYLNKTYYSGWEIQEVKEYENTI